MSVLISCEVGGTRIPTELTALVESCLGSGSSGGDSAPRMFQPSDGSSGKALVSLGFDRPARDVARRMSQQLRAPLIANEYSMDLIDVTRSLHHRGLFPSLTRRWSPEHRQRLMDQIHTPYRERIRMGIQQLLAKCPCVIHLSIRSFALRKKGTFRRADAGLLYDPSRDDEVDFCLDWIDEMYDAIPMLRVRRNYPRRGTTDSLTRSMRHEFSGSHYVGIEVLLNRAWVGRPLAIRDEVVDQMCVCLREVLALSQVDAA